MPHNERAVILAQKRSFACLSVLSFPAWSKKERERTSVGSDSLTTLTPATTQELTFSAASWLVGLTSSLNRHVATLKPILGEIRRRTSGKRVVQQKQ